MKRYNITVNGTAYDVTVEETDGSAKTGQPCKNQTAAQKGCKA